MRALMFGWEFPPHVSGGLGTACRGLTGGLARLGVDVLFVVPRAFGDEDAGAVRLVDAGRVRAARGGGPRGGALVREVPVDSALLAYLTEGRYEPPRPAAAARMVVARRGPAARALYGRDLMAEVERYAGAAAAVARREAFDVVHAHDWMTWPAGIEAAAASGRPLVVHVHSCEHDRSGSRGSARVEAVEQRGLDAADAIVCVSHYAARTIARRYRVDGS
jgi:hypothetical protein